MSDQSVSHSIKEDLHSVEIPMAENAQHVEGTEESDTGLFTHLLHPLSRTFKFNRVVLDSRSVMLKCLHGADFVMSLRVIRKGGKGFVKLTGADADKVFLAAKACREHLGHWLKE